MHVVFARGEWGFGVCGDDDTCGGRRVLQGVQQSFASGSDGSRSKDAHST